MQKWRWTAARLAFIGAALAATATGNILAFLLGPLYSWYFFQDLNCFKHYRHFNAITACGWKMVLTWLREPEYRNMFAIPLTAPPLLSPDLSLVKVSAAWPKDAAACNGCAQCCTRIACPLLDREVNHCRSYGSFYWRYFNCGRYPERLAQIRYYHCKKWEVLGEGE
ncbi:MAG: hypothetical protein M0009_02500 [Deltaproteobacteria bacterium]|nr:hypothetical protein [Deltaproteobacteria bacterium]